MALPDLTYEQAKELAGGPFGAVTLRNAGSYVVPISWPASVDNVGMHLRNGTAFFVRTPQMVFAVTAAHVVRSFIQHKRQVPDAVCGLIDSETPIDLERDLIAMGRHFDIATFQVSERTIAKLGKQPMTAWPPRTPQVGKGVVYAGFPGMVRERIAPREFSFGLVSGATVADSVSETRIITVVNQGDLQDPLGHGLPPSDFEFGGMSGGPMIAVIETGLISWALAGVITDGGSLLGGTLFATPATCIQADGTIAE